MYLIFHQITKLPILSMLTKINLEVFVE